MVETLVRVLLDATSLVMILLIASLGLGVIFGLMHVINLAHGGFVTIGAYTIYTTAQYTDPIVAFVLAPVVVGLIGVAVELTVIKRLYDNPLLTVLATWGISLIIIQGVELVYGPADRQVAAPALLAGKVNLLGVDYSSYRTFLIVLGLSLLAFTFYLFRRTDFGLQSMAVIQDDATAGSLGVNVDRINTLTFGLGSALAGLAGAAFAPLATVHPEVGFTLLLESFFVVMIGGLGSFVGILWASVTLGGIRSVVGFLTTVTTGQTVEFIVAIVLITIVHRRELSDII